MRKYLFLALLSGIAFPLFQPCVSAQTDATAEDALQTVSKSALAAKRAGTKLNETLLHKTVLDYSLPVDIAAVSKKCAAGETDACYFSFKTFENSTDTSVAAAANLELAVLSQQRGLIKQALSYIDRIIDLPIGLFAVSLGSVLMASMTHAAAAQGCCKIFSAMSGDSSIWW